MSLNLFPKALGLILRIFNLQNLKPRFQNCLYQVCKFETGFYSCGWPLLWNCGRRRYLLLMTSDKDIQLSTIQIKGWTCENLGQKRSVITAESIFFLCPKQKKRKSFLPSAATAEEKCVYFESRKVEICSGERFIGDLSRSIAKSSHWDSKTTLCAWWDQKDLVYQTLVKKRRSISTVCCSKKSENFKK